MIESTITDGIDRVTVATGNLTTVFWQGDHPPGETTGQCAAVQIASLQQQLVEQGEILAKLPKCWQLFGQSISVEDADAEPGPGKLVQDCPVVPGMEVYYQGDRWRVLSISDTHTVQLTCWEDQMHRTSLFAYDCANSPEAAAALGQRSEL